MIPFSSWVCTDLNHVLRRSDLRNISLVYVFSRMHRDLQDKIWSQSAVSYLDCIRPLWRCDWSAHTWRSWCWFQHPHPRWSPALCTTPGTNTAQRSPCSRTSPPRSCTCSENCVLFVIGIFVPRYIREVSAQVLNNMVTRWRPFLFLN